MKHIMMNRKLCLRLFAENSTSATDFSADGGDTGENGAKGVTATAAMPQNKGAKQNPLVSVQYGTREDAASPAAEVTEDRNAEFESLIKGKFKDLYDARMQDTIQKRLKGTKEIVDKYNALTPTLALLAEKYGVDATDANALQKALQEDMAKGVSETPQKEIEGTGPEKEDLEAKAKEQLRRENADKIYTSWMNQSEETKTVYPTFDLRTEMQNPKFIRLLRNDIDVQTAYEVIHKEEIFPAVMRVTADRVRQKLTNHLMASGARPPENGNTSGSAFHVKNDVSKLSKADRAEINRRVAKGEIIRF